VTEKEAQHVVQAGSSDYSFHMFDLWDRLVLPSLIDVEKYQVRIASDEAVMFRVSRLKKTDAAVCLHEPRVSDRRARGRFALSPFLGFEWSDTRGYPAISASDASQCRQADHASTSSRFAI
jgi:hypothetical protein